MDDGSDVPPPPAVGSFADRLDATLLRQLNASAATARKNRTTTSMN